VTSIMDGFNVCIMAYGQTGSGKTYTIEGPADNPGVNSRALEEVFAVAEERADDVSYSFSASVLEIYNEQIFDLLAGSRDTSEQLEAPVVAAADTGTQPCVPPLLLLVAQFASCLHHAVNT